MGDSNIVPINMVIIGNKGHGKSSLGNFILNKTKFTVSGNGVAPSRTLVYGAGKRGNFTMKVVEMTACPDGPNNQLQAYNHRAYEMCDHNLHLFLLVIKFDGANTGRCLQVFDRWREILGSDIFARRGVVVITFGDEFKRLMMENGMPDKTFSEWCCEQDGDLLRLLEECNPRRILFNNNARTEHTFEELSKYMLPLSYTDDRYQTQFNESTKCQTNSSFWDSFAKFSGGVVVIAIIGIIYFVPTRK